MKEQLIDFKTAKLAKELGFNWKCNTYYGEKINPHIAYGSKDSILQDFNTPNIGRNWKYRVSAPTQSLLQKWLRDVHNLWVTVEFGFRIEYVIRHCKEDFIWNTNHIYIEGLFDEYEEALEAGLLKSLDYLKSLK